MHRLKIGFMHVENGIFPALSIPKDNQLKHLLSPSDYNLLPRHVILLPVPRCNLQLYS
jgi:hypothetical protein